MRKILCISIFFIFSNFLICQEKAVVYDDFVRFTNQRVIDLGIMSDGIHKWIKRVPEGYEDLIFGSLGRLYIGYKSGLQICDTGVAVENFTIRDGIIELEIGPSVMEGRTNGAYINYRAKDIQSAAGAKTQDAYHVGLELEEKNWIKDKDIVLYYGTNPLAYGDFSDKIDIKTNHTLKVLFEENHHVVWFDGKKVIDYFDNTPERIRDGYVGFGGFYSCGFFNKFSLFKIKDSKQGSQMKEEKISYLFKKEKEIPPVIFNGKPIFIISTYSTPEIGGTEEEWTEWVSAGANVAQMAVNIQKIDEEINDVKKHLERCEKYKVPALFFIHNIESRTSDGKPIPTTKEDIPKRIENFKKLFEITKNNPWVLGYYFFDEPENWLYQQYAKMKDIDIKKWEQKYDSGLAAWIADSFKWLYDLVKKEHPQAYVFVLPGWETCYKDMAPIYDVLQANSYPNLAPVPPLTGDLFIEIHDARMAAEACRITGKTFIYMPGIADNFTGWPNARPGTYKETRYCFFAPITQGAMGLNPFCLYRCTQNYRKAVVYPILREVKRFIPWFLGEWHDDKVSSDHDTATKDYLMKYPPRIKEIMADKGTQIIKMAGIPDCSYILRRNPNDGSYILLAVNNCRESIDVTFSFKGINITGKALEMLEYYYVDIIDNKLKDHFGPFDVRVYLIKEK
jgi:hypothetical protein